MRRFALGLLMFVAVVAVFILAQGQARETGGSGGAATILTAVDGTGATAAAGGLELADTDGAHLAVLQGGDAINNSLVWDDPNSQWTVGAVPECITFTPWCPCTGSGATNCTPVLKSAAGGGDGTCSLVTNINQTQAVKGGTFPVNTNVYNYATLEFSASADPNVVNAIVNASLRDLTADPNMTAAATIPSTNITGQTCVDRSSAATNIASLTGTHYFAVLVGDPNGGGTTDPLFTCVTAKFCKGI